MFQRKVLQGPSHLILLRQQQDVIVQLQGVEYTKVDADGHRGRSLLHSRNGHGRTGGTFRHLRHTEVPAKPGQPDLLAHRLHFLLQFPGHFRAHRCFAHIDVTNIPLKMQKYNFFSNIC